MRVQVRCDVGMSLRTCMSFGSRHSLIKVQYLSSSRVETPHCITMTAPVPVAGPGGMGGNAIPNAVNMVAEHGGIFGGQRVPIQQGGIPEAERGRMGRADSRSRSSTVKRRTQTPLARESPMRLNPSLFCGFGGTQQQAQPQQAQQQQQQQHKFS